MKPEKTQAGNPHQLTINQHCFPKRSVERFTVGGKVELFHMKMQKRIPVVPKNAMFCAMRVWNQKAESNMTQIENRYQNIANQIVGGSIKTLTRDQKHSITEMYSLWNTRTHFKHNPVGPVKINGIQGVSHKATLDEQEMLEKHGVFVTRPDLTMSGRDIVSARASFMMDNFQKLVGDLEWKIIVSSEGEFIVPDHSPQLHFLPVTPKLALLAGLAEGDVGGEFVSTINTASIRSSREYYFARKLDACPTHSI